MTISIKNPALSDQNPQSSKIIIKTDKIITNSWDHDPVKTDHCCQVCYYNAGAMFDIVDPGPENKAEQGVVDEVLRLDFNNISGIFWKV